jgi:hypothetical protein
MHFRNEHYGFESGGCVDGFHGMYPDTCDECRSFVDKEMAEFAARPLHVVLTGTFPQLGGGSGLKVGKDKMTKLVQSTNYGKVVSALSCKVTHLVTGDQPGAAKLKQASQSYGYCRVVTYDEFLPIVQEKLRNPPRHPTSKEKADKRVADDELKAEREKRVKARLDNEQNFQGYVSATAAAAAAASASTDTESTILAGIPVAAAAAVALPPVTRSLSDGTDYSPIHLLYFKRRQWKIIESGGGGNCFFYSVAAINKIYGNRRPLFKSHFALRKQICAFWASNLHTLHAGGMNMRDVVGIKQLIAKTSAADTDAEYEVVCAFSAMIGEAVIIWNVHHSLPWVIFPDGRLLKEDEVLPDTPWRLWANGFHYQAAVGQAMFTMKGGKPLPLTDVVHMNDVVCIAPQ